MTLRIGIIGVGAIAERAFLPGFAEPDSPEARRSMPDWNYNGCPDTRVVMLASRNQKNAARVATEYSVPRVTGDWHELVSSPDIDAVCITTPNYLHHEMAVAAARAGKHVLVEKPMALSLRQADEMIETAKASHRVLMVQQTQRFLPVHELAKQLIDSGAIGRVLSIRARLSHGGPEHWSPSGQWFFEKRLAGAGALYDLGIHKFDLIRFLTGKEAALVSAFTATLAKEIEVDDSAVAIMKFADGAFGVVEASWASSPQESSCKVYGTKGNLQVGLDSSIPISIDFDEPPDKSGTVLPPGKWEGTRFVPNVPVQSALGGPLRHFADCIRLGIKCIASGADNRNSLEIMLAAARSQETGQIVQLPIDADSPPRG